jgi:hypothetical protein
MYGIRVMPCIGAYLPLSRLVTQLHEHHRQDASKSCEIAARLWSIPGTNAREVAFFGVLSCVGPRTVLAARYLTSTFSPE